MDLDGEGLVWYAKPQLFFNVTLCPTGKARNSFSHKQVSLVFFSTFEPINLTPNSVMQKNGIPMFFDSASSSNELSLYICEARNVLGRAPMMPCFLEGNPTPTLPHRFGNRDCAVADTANGR